MKDALLHIHASHLATMHVFVIANSLKSYKRIEIYVILGTQDNVWCFILVGAKRHYHIPFF